MPRTPRAETRDRILDAALRAFATTGVAGTNVTDIEAAAGLTPGSGGFYRYFPTKDAALGAIVERELARVEARHADVAGATVAGSDDGTGTADVRVQLGIEFAEALAALDRMRLLIALLAREHGQIPDLDRRINDVMVAGGARVNGERLAARMHAGRIPPRDPAALTAVLMSALVGYHLAGDYFGGPPAGVGRDAFVSTLVDLVAPAPAPD